MRVAMKLKAQMKRRWLSVPVLVGLALLCVLSQAPVGHAHPGHYRVPIDWPLIPAGVKPGDSFRLLFVTSNLRNAEPTIIDYYNEHVERAADKNPNLEPYQFRALGSTADVDARDNTNTAVGEGVPKPRAERGRRQRQPEAFPSRRWLPYRRCRRVDCNLTSHQNIRLIFTSHSPTSRRVCDTVCCHWYGNHMNNHGRR